MSYIICDECNKSRGEYELMSKQLGHSEKVRILCWECALNFFVHYFHWPLNYEYISIKTR